MAPAEEQASKPSLKMPKGFFLIKNKDSGQYLNGHKGYGMVTTSTQQCPQLDQFEWEPEIDGVYGRLKSKTTNLYLTVIGKNVYFSPKRPSSKLIGQKWRIVRDLIVSELTQDNGILVLSYNRTIGQTGKLIVSKTDYCNKHEHKWQLQSVDEDESANKIPEDVKAFGIQHIGKNKVLALNSGWLSVFIELSDSDCDDSEEWTWVWDESGDWGRIVPKSEPHLALKLSKKSKEVSVSEFAQSDSPDDFKWSLLGQWIIPKVIPAHALTLKEGPWPEFVVSPIECGGANQLFKIFVLDCDKAN